MGNIANGIKKFLGNKNTVTIVGVLVGIVVLWAFYSYRVKEATTPIKVPYAKVQINATEEITAEDIAYVEINSAFLNKTEILQNSNQVIGKYVTTGTSIPAGGLFYKSQVVEKSALPNTVFDDIEDGNALYSLKVDNHTTYGNSIYPGDKIDLFLKATSDEGKIIFGRFISSITVLAVRDSSGKNVFDSTEARVPAELLFSVKTEDYKLLMDAGYISGITVIPVPRNSKYTEEGAEMVTDQDFTSFILAHVDQSIGGVE